MKPRLTPASYGARLLALLAVVPLAVTLAGPASAAGESTPGVTVTAVNPPGSRVGSDLSLSLTAHTEAGGVASSSCGPGDGTLKCWGSLMLRIPRYGDLGVGAFEVHRVAVGDISCGDEGDDGCGDPAVAAAAGTGGPVPVQVNGVGFVKWPGNTGLPVGTKLQLKFTLTDNGTAAYEDQVVVQVNRFVEGPAKPLLYRSGPETIKQVQIHDLATRG